MNTTIIGVSGTNGSGKDTVMQLLATKYNYLFVSATDLLGAELERRGEPLDREHKAALSAEWRREHGMGVIVRKAYETYLDQQDRYDGVVVGSLRHPGEADEVHGFNGTVLWIDAEPEVRYNRIQANLHARGDRSAEDMISFEEFQAQEAREMSQSGDAATLNMSAVKDRADVFLDNGGTDIREFELRVEDAFGLERR